MCLIVFSWAPGSGQPLLLLANRDEFHARPTAPLAQWHDLPRVHAGRDLQAGGSWLGIAPQGRFAALTNIRRRESRAGRSRGELVSGYLSGQEAPSDYLRAVALRSRDFNGFNLLAGDAGQLWYLHSADEKPKPVAPGIYALSNAALNTHWPKLVRVRERFSRQLDADDEALFGLMRDDWRPPDGYLPDTGVGLVMERMLSSIFIQGERYGTRATSIVRMSSAGLELQERGYDPDGRQRGRASLMLPINAPDGAAGGPVLSGRGGRLLS